MKTEANKTDISLEQLSLERLKLMRETLKKIELASPEAIRKASLKDHYVPKFNRSPKRAK